MYCKVHTGQYRGFDWTWLSRITCKTKEFQLLASFMRVNSNYHKANVILGHIKKSIVSRRWEVFVLSRNGKRVEPRKGACNLSFSKDNKRSSLASVLI